jgi:hypothetical protein
VREIVNVGFEGLRICSSFHPRILPDASSPTNTAALFVEGLECGFVGHVDFLGLLLG